VELIWSGSSLLGQNQRKILKSGFDWTKMLGRGGLIDEIIEAPRLSGTQKTREYFWGFYATCVGVY